MLNLRVALPDLVVDLGRLEELKEIAANRTNIRVGALTTHAAIEDGKLPEAFGGLVQKVASKISYRAVRNHGTVGGSVALADPAADWPGCLLALGAQARIAGRKGTRCRSRKSHPCGFAR
jgi:carbon-monoxide dehydrogenase medium subunit